VTTGENVTLDASASTDTYGEITAYDWTVDGESFSGETATTTFETTGEVTVELTVTNDAGETNTTSSTVSVVTAGDGTDSDTNTDGNGNTDTDGSGTDDSIPGFTSGLAVLALVVSLLIARRID
jgi:PGF-CTERM protein